MPQSIFLYVSNDAEHCNVQLQSETHYQSYTKLCIQIIISVNSNSNFIHIGHIVDKTATKTE